MNPHPVVDPDRRLGVGDADVDVQRERRLAAGELAHRAVDELVALAAGNRDLLPDREGVGPGDGGAEPERLERLGEPWRSEWSSSTASETAG